MKYQSLKKLLSPILSIAILFGLLTTMPLEAIGASTPSNWAVDAVERAISLDILPESIQERYRYEATRAEFCVLAVALYEAVTGGEITERITFEDCDDINVEKAAAIGVVKGTGGNKFTPKGKLNREQAATMLARLAEAMGKPLAKQETTFNDKDNISSWALESVGQVQAESIMKGTGDNKFSPKTNYTIDMCIVTIMRLYDLGNIEVGINYKAWALGCSAILAQRNGYNIYQFGMFVKNDANAIRAQNMLSGSWGCYSREDVLETIESMTDYGHNASFAWDYAYVSSLTDQEYQLLLEHSSGIDSYMWPLTKTLGDKWGDKQIKAWDWFRMIHLAGWGYVAGYLELEEAYDCMTPVIERLLNTFSSWEEANDNYMDGYAWWSRTDVSKPGTEYKNRLTIYESIKNYPPEMNPFDPSVWQIDSAK